jgi:hypothetical protein
VANKRGKQTQGRLTVKVRHLAVHGAEARLAQAVDLLLKSAVMKDTTYQENANSRKEEPSHQGTAQDTPTELSGIADGKK